MDWAEANRRAARSAGGYLSLHAAAVETSAGVVALAGRSHSGKSTLAATAVKAGYGYVADEITAVHPESLRVRPFHRPIGLRRGGASAVGISNPIGDETRDGEVCGWDVPRDMRSSGGRLAGIVLVEWAMSAPEDLTFVSVPAALLSLTEHAIVEDDPELKDAFSRLEAIARAVPVARMRYATASQSLVLLAELVDRWSD